MRGRCSVTLKPRLKGQNRKRPPPDQDPWGDVKAQAACLGPEFEEPTAQPRGSRPDFLSHFRAGLLGATRGAGRGGGAGVGGTVPRDPSRARVSCCLLQCLPLPPRVLLGRGACPVHLGVWHSSRGPQLRGFLTSSHPSWCTPASPPHPPSHTVSHSRNSRGGQRRPFSALSHLQPSPRHRENVLSRDPLLGTAWEQQVPRPQGRNKLSREVQRGRVEQGTGPQGPGAAWVPLPGTFPSSQMTA